MSIRSMSVAGSFYPDTANEINDMIFHFNSVIEAHPDIIKSFSALYGNAVIVPHAGWIYSGFTANVAYRILNNAKPSTVVVIGPSHRVGFEGISIADFTLFQTPLGNLKIDTQLTQELKERFALPCYPEAHHEHSTEVQMPFIKHYLPDVRVVELVYAYAEPSMIEPIIEECLSRKDTAIVISTDLSHYYTLSQAQQLDSICLEAIREEDSDKLHQGCEACGMIGVEAMLNIAKKRDFKNIILDYRTSADASQDTSRVVGYASVLFYET